MFVANTPGASSTRRTAGRRVDSQLVERIWKAHWPPGLDEARIRLPQAPLTVILKRNARRTPAKPALIFYGRELSFEWCRNEMAVYKAPRAIRFVSALPKTASGKILKRYLRDQARSGE